MTICNFYLLNHLYTKYLKKKEDSIDFESMMQNLTSRAWCKDELGDYGRQLVGFDNEHEVFQRVLG